MGVTALFEEQIVSPRLPGASDLAVSKGTRPVLPIRRAERRPVPVPDINIDQSVESSLKSIERIIGNYGALSDNVQYYKTAADKNEKALQSERDIGREMRIQLDAMQKENANLQSLLRAEKQRAAEASACIVALEDCVKSLEEENTVLRSQSIRLVQGIEMLMAAENSLQLA